MENQKRSENSFPDPVVLLTQNTAEILTQPEIEKLALSKKFRFYYGIAPTGPVHLGYLVPLGKVIDCIKAGGDATILIADYHAYLDDRKTSWGELQVRSDYYEKCIQLALGKFASKVKFVRGSSFQNKKEFIEDLFKVAGLITLTRATRAASEVVRMTDPKVSSLMYPLMQCLDVKFLGSDLAVGGTDQRHIYVLARDILPEVGFKSPSFIFMPLIGSLKGPDVKMSASAPGTHIKIHETEAELKKLVASAYCPEKVVQGNPIIELVKYIIFPFNGKLAIQRSEKFGGNITYTFAEKLIEDFRSGKLHPQDLKNGVFDELKSIIAPIRKYFEEHPELVAKVSKTYGWDKF